ncbi:hypothetical protein EMCRGX_G000874 [Ephydatia muelleri]
MIECAYGFYEKVQLALGRKKSNPEAPVTTTKPKVVSGETTSSLSRFFTGVVTSLDEGGGMIDQHVFFDQSSVLGNERIEVGSTVHVQAAREHQQAGWRATRVQLVVHWKPDASSGTHVVVGFISNLGRSQGIVSDGNDDVRFPLTAVSSNYRPNIGDWVQIFVLEQDGAATVSAVTPLRRRVFHGVVSNFNRSEGTVDGNVSFAADVVCNGYRPRLGEEVSGECVEWKSATPWRALSLKPSNGAKPLGCGKIDRLVQQNSAVQALSRSELLGNKEGITITGSGDFGDLQVGDDVSVNFILTNTNERDVTLVSWRLLIPDPRICVEIEKVDSGNPSPSVISTVSPPENVPPSMPCDLKLMTDAPNSILDSCVVLPRNGSVIEVTVKLKADAIGHTSNLLLFNFGSFKIARAISASVKDEAITLLTSRAPYQQRQQGGGWTQGSYHAKMRAGKLPGPRPMRPVVAARQHKMKDYLVPGNLRDMMEEMDTDITAIQPQLAEPLSLDNYREVFSTLLWLEEIAKEQEIRKHDLASVNCLGLTVPGLAEGRPKLLVGDKVMICRPGGTDNEIHYEGIIHKIYGEDILMQFNQEVQEDLAGEECDVMFTFNRAPLCRMHHAADMAVMLGAQVLFPTCPSPMPPLAGLDSTTFYNPILNDRQKSAVTRIVGARCRPMPYVLFGPPGTGKTVTVVESILQILFQCTSSRILACAPSNSAVDLLVKRLHDSGQIMSGMMVRLNALSRSTPPPPSILQYCVTADQVATVVRLRLVLCTCVTAGTLHRLGLSPGHFSHVFVDEAGQAAEPECLIPTSLLVGSQGQMVLAGDPMQLGPVIGSLLAAKFGLNKSLLERLMERQPYKRDPRKFADHGNFDPLVVTKLVDNYRAHGLLVRLYSELFYDGELLERASEDKTHCLCTWDKLPKTGVPIVFHGVQVGLL